MKKIPTLFNRNPEHRQELLPEPNTLCDWVFAGEGVATRKYDGACCRVVDTLLWKRRELKPGQVTPPGFEDVDYDEATGKTVGWVPVGDGPEDKWFREAVANGPYPDGTYELIGPKVQGNPEGYSSHTLISHRTAPSYPEAPRTFDGLRAFLEPLDIEGLVFHHADGRMAKIKKRDFGLRRK